MAGEAGEEQPFEGIDPEERKAEYLKGLTQTLRIVEDAGHLAIGTAAEIIEAGTRWADDNFFDNKILGEPDIGEDE